MKKKLNCVLLVDDDEPTNFLSKMVVEKAACTDHIQVAQSGKDALEYLSRISENNSDNPGPDLIFLDINMPAMDGWEFISRYNNLTSLQKDKIIMVMLTTSLNPDDRLRAIDMPAVTGFESKPLTPKKLETILHNYFNDRF
jgi:CheY-like chemotaxis protein